MNILQFEKSVREKYKNLTTNLIHNNITITTMESCTSGQIASLITDTEGSSAILKGAFITYSNKAKILQGVPSSIIEKYGVYSIETATSMAKAAQNAYNANISIGVTGTTGNIDPQNPAGIPGKVYFCILYNEKIISKVFDVPLQNSRYEYKLYIADVIVDSLLEEII